MDQLGLARLQEFCSHPSTKHSCPTTLLKISLCSVAELDKKVWGGRHQNKLKYINHIAYNTFKSK